METSASVPPLSQFSIVTTSRLDEARDAVTKVYLPHRLDSADGDRLRMTLNAAEAARFTVGFLAYGAKTRLDMPPTENSYHINLTTKGKTFAARTDGSRAVTAAQASGLVLLPDQLASPRCRSRANSSRRSCSPSCCPRRLTPTPASWRAPRTPCPRPGSRR
jgi:hypothetical protein